MKLTWHEQDDGSWRARYYARGDTDWLEPFTLSVWREDSDFPWHWEVRRHGDVLTKGQATEDEGARMTATGQLRHHIFA